MRYGRPQAIKPGPEYVFLPDRLCLRESTMTLPGIRTSWRGVSGLFGIELVPNFRMPFFSARLQRVLEPLAYLGSHTGLRDYIFFPITRLLKERNPRRANLLALIIPPVAAMLVSALWHQIALRYYCSGDCCTACIR